VAQKIARPQQTFSAFKQVVGGEMVFCVGEKDACVLGCGD